MFTGTGSRLLLTGGEGDGLVKGGKNIMVLQDLQRKVVILHLVYICMLQHEKGPQVGVMVT